MACGSITSLQIDGETMKTVADFILGGSKITADGDGSHEIKRHLLLGRKVMTNIDSILKAETLLCQCHHHDYLGHEDLFCAVFPYILATSS